jgi:ABC-type multidrug transport system permease subunit
MRLGLKTALAGLITAGALGVAVPAQAQTSAVAHRAPMAPATAAAAWHFFDIYTDVNTCIRTGSQGVSQHRWLNYRCDDGGFIWVLYVYY